MLASSILFKIYQKILAILRSYKDSKINKILNNITFFISTVFHGSIIYKYLEREDHLEKYAKRSVILHFFDSIIVSIIGFFSKKYKLIRKKNVGSLNNTFYKIMNGKSFFKYENILGFLMVIMFIIPGHLWNNVYALLMAVGLIVLYFIVLLSGRNFSYHLKSFDIIMMIFMFSSALAVLISYSLSDSIRVFMFFVTSYIFMICVAGCLKDLKSINGLIGILYVGILITSLYCIIQGIQGVDVDAKLTDVTTNLGMPGRAYSTFENPNNYAEFLVMFFPFFIAFSLNLKEKRAKIFSFIVLLIPIIALIYTYSRSCWVSFAITLVVFICFYNYKYIPLLLLGGIAAFPFLPQSVINRILTIGSMSDTSNQYRILIWDGVLKMLQNTWFSGIGLGPSAFSKLYPSFAHSNAVLAPHSHMLFLEVLVEMGVLGFISFIGYWFMTLKRSVTTLIKVNLSYEHKNLIIAGISSLTGIIFVSGVEYIWFYPRVMFSFFVVIGIVMATLKLHPSLKKERNR